MLPESYERLLGFDPQDPDSDSTITQQNSDTDEDSLLDGLEVIDLGTDPLSKDTDDDDPAYRWSGLL
jgi:hypothetical protein